MIQVKILGGFVRPGRSGTMECELGPNESVSTAIVRAVSAVEGREPCSLRPLADIVAPAALDALFDPRGDGTARTGGRLSIVYSDCWVTIDDGEYLRLGLLENRSGDEPDRAPIEECL
jgi:hypothetical protein